MSLSASAYARTPSAARGMSPVVDGLSPPWSRARLSGDVPMGAGPAIAQIGGTKKRGMESSMMFKSVPGTVRIEVVTASLVASGEPQGVHDLGRLLEQLN